MFELLKALISQYNDVSVQMANYKNRWDKSSLLLRKTVTQLEWDFDQVWCEQVESQQSKPLCHVW